MTVVPIDLGVVLSGVIGVLLGYVLRVIQRLAEPDDDAPPKTQAEIEKKIRYCRRKLSDAKMNPEEFGGDEKFIKGMKHALEWTLTEDPYADR